MAHKCASNLIDFKKVVTMTSLTLSEYTFSYSHNDSLMYMKTITVH